jgi:hypothetical protein
MDAVETFEQLFYCKGNLLMLGAIKTKYFPTRSTAPNGFFMSRDATACFQDVLNATHAIEAITQSVNSSSSVRRFSGSAR